MQLTNTVFRTANRNNRKLSGVMMYIKPFLTLLLTIAATYPSEAGEEVDVFDGQLKAALAR